MVVLFDMDTNTQYKIKLEEMRNSIVTELETIAVHNNETDDWEVKTDNTDTDDADENLQADAAEDADTRIATLTELETRYRSIVRALQKIATGTYGVCELSGEPIEEARLNANPAARTCITHRDNEAELPL